MGVRWIALLLVILAAPVLGNERLVSGVVYSCMKDGVRHYMSSPPAGCGETRTITYSYIERILKPGEQAIYKCRNAAGVETYSGKAGFGCQYVASYFEAPRPPVAPRIAQPPTRSGNYPCSSDCSGHRAGYEWARNRGISDQYQCTGNSQSFIEGCRAFTEGHPGF